MLVVGRGRGAVCARELSGSPLVRRRNYGITGKIDEQLQISGAVDKATSSFNDFKGSVTDKVTELKKSTEASD